MARNRVRRLIPPPAGAPGKRGRLGIIGCRGDSISAARTDLADPPRERVNAGSLNTSRSVSEETGLRLQECDDLVFLATLRSAEEPCWGGSGLLLEDLEGGQAERVAGRVGVDAAVVIRLAVVL